MYVSQFSQARVQTQVQPYLTTIGALLQEVELAELRRAPEDEYSGKLKTLAELVTRVNDLRTGSARDTTLLHTVNRAKALRDSATALSKEMTAGYAEVQSATMTLLRETQKSLEAQAQKLTDEYTTALTGNHLEFCHTLQDARVKLHLIIAAKTPTGDGKVKPDTVAHFIAEHENDKNFEIVPAFVASFAVAGEKSFEVEGDAIRALDPAPKFAPSAFMMWRIADRRPYWAAVGTAPGRGNLPDAHVGLVLRLGEEKLKTNLVLGAGMSIAHTPIGLRDASVGSALPAGKSLVDVTCFGYRTGATLFLTISGLSVSLGEQGIAASPDAKK